MTTMPLRFLTTMRLLVVEAAAAGGVQRTAMVMTTKTTVHCLAHRRPSGHACEFRQCAGAVGVLRRPRGDVELAFVRFSPCAFPVMNSQREREEVHKFAT